MIPSSYFACVAYLKPRQRTWARSEGSGSPGRFVGPLGANALRRLLARNGTLHTLDLRDNARAGVAELRRTQTFGADDGSARQRPLSATLVRPSSAKSLGRPGTAEPKKNISLKKEASAIKNLLRSGIF